MGHIPPCELDALLNEGECVMPYVWFMNCVDELIIMFREHVTWDEPYDKEINGYRTSYIKVYLTK